MKVLCTYSGLPYEASGFELAGITLARAPHPCFSLKPSQLIGASAASSSWPIADRYRLWLATVNSTGLVQWSCSLDPSKSEGKAASLGCVSLEAYIGYLLSNVGELTAQVCARIRLKRGAPKLAIGRDNNTLETVACYVVTLSEWLAEQDATKEEMRKASRDRALTQAVNELWAKAYGSKSETSLAKLIAWCAEATQWPEGMASQFKAIITTLQASGASGLAKAYRKDFTPVLELLEEIETRLELAGTKPAQILQRGLREAKKLHESKHSLAESIKLVDGKAQLVSSAQELDAVRAALARAGVAKPEQAPQRSNYTSALAYLQAKAAWDAGHKTTDTKEA